MNRSFPFSVSNVVIGLVFLAMAIVGWKLGATGAKTDGDASSPIQSSRIPSRSDQVRDTDKRRIRALTAAVRDAGDTQDRMRATISLVNALPVSELGRWLSERRFENRDGFELTLFNKLAKERWRQEDPEGFLAWAVREGEQSTDVVVSRWAENDPQRLLAFFKETPDTGQELKALGQIAKNDPALALKRYREMLENSEIGAQNSYQGEQFLRELAQSSPEALDAALESLPDDVRALAESALVGERLKTDFDGEIRKLWANPDGWRVFEASLNGAGGVDLGNRMLANIDEIPDSWKASMSDSYYRFISRENARDWLALDFDGKGFNDQQAERMRTYAIQQIASSDPAGAIKGMEGLGMSEGNREGLIRNIFSRIANDAEKVSELMGMLDSNADREAAGAIVESRNLLNPNGSEPRPPVETPAQWIELAGNFDPGQGSQFEMTYMLRSWSKEQFDELANQFQSMPDENKEEVARLLSGAQSSVAIDPGLQGEAIRYLVENPSEGEAANTRQSEKASSMTSRHAVSWGMKDPVAASQWTNTLPSGEARLWAQKNLAANWARYDPDAANRWVGSLPAADRKQVKSFMASGK